MLDPWVNENEKTVLFYGICLMMIAFIVSQIRLPSTFRNGIMPAINRIELKIDSVNGKLDNLTERVNLLIDIEAQGLNKTYLKDNRI